MTKIFGSISERHQTKSHDSHISTKKIPFRKVGMRVEIQQKPRILLIK